MSHPRVVLEAQNTGRGPTARGYCTVGEENADDSTILETSFFSSCLSLVVHFFSPRSYCEPNGELVRRGSRVWEGSREHSLTFFLSKMSVAIFSLSFSTLARLFATLRSFLRTRFSAAGISILIRFISSLSPTISAAARVVLRLRTERRAVERASRDLVRAESRTASLFESFVSARIGRIACE